MLALLAVMRDGRAIETMSIGCEGEFGFLWGFYKRESFTRAIVRLPGKLLRIETDGLRKEYGRSEQLRSFKYAAAQAVHLLQCFAHNKTRFCRWLLTMSDKWTGQLLAEALGANRKSITLAAQKLPGRPH